MKEVVQACLLKNCIHNDTKGMCTHPNPELMQYRIGVECLTFKGIEKKPKEDKEEHEYYPSCCCPSCTMWKDEVF